MRHFRLFDLLPANHRDRVSRDVLMVKIILIGLIRFYQMSLSHILGGCCRFYPTCSEYCLQAIREHGSLRGSALGLVRLCKCRPFHPGGFDPVPSPDASRRHGVPGQTVNMLSKLEVERIP